MKVLALDLLFDLSLAAYREQIVLDADKDLFFLEPGQLGFDDDLLGGFIDIAVRDPCRERKVLLREWLVNSVEACSSSRQRFVLDGETQVV